MADYRGIFNLIADYERAFKAFKNANENTRPQISEGLQEKAMNIILLAANKGAISLKTLEEKNMLNESILNGGRKKNYRKLSDTVRHIRAQLQKHQKDQRKNNGKRATPQQYDIT